MTENYRKLIRTLRQLFEMDKADLDFGIYRIMNQKRDEINSFLENDLLPQVKEAFAGLEQSDKAGLQKDLEDAIEDAKDLGAPDPENVPKVLAIKERMASSVDITAMEQEVYSHLHTFFSRYYDKGDFISLRRYKNDTYAIPYEGEEVKLHWANADQYYIKTSEHLRDYAFIVKGDDDKAVRIKLMEADTEKDNTKSQNGERRFVLDGDKPLEVVGDELQIHFNYVPRPKNIKQEKLNKEAVATIFAQEGYTDWMAALQQKAPTDKNPDRTILEKHLNDYTARNTFDYFIHKDLGGFLRRELDFYVKNEVLYLDDIDSGSVVATEHLLRKIRAIRTIALKIIIMLAQLEDFQKKLWLKKKFVVETNYCLTMDRVPDELHGDIIGCDAQWQEWVELGFLDDFIQDTGKRKEILREQSFLVVDTIFYGEEFKDRLLTSFDGLDEQCDGLLIHSENFQVLNLLQERYRGQVKCVYIDPPYNSPSSEILYKNSFFHSSWLSLIRDRVACSSILRRVSNVYIVAIDENEQDRLSILLSFLFSNDEKTCISIINNPSGQQGDNFSYTHDYSIFIYDKKTKLGKEIRTCNIDIRNFRDVTGEDSKRKAARNCFYPIFIKDGRLVGFGDVCDEKFHPENINIEDDNGIIAVYPVDPHGVERKWRFARQTVESIEQELFAHFLSKKGVWDIKRKKNTFNFKTVWTDAKYSSNNHGTQLLNHIIPNCIFDYPKSLYTVSDCIAAGTNRESAALILDYFAGSGTTGHAVIDLNRKDNGNRKYILVEMGQYFNTVLKPRIQKVIYSKDWQKGKPKPDADGDLNPISHCFKYLRLESYEDTLNNLVIKKPDAKQQSLLDINPELKEDYVLSYWLDVETKDSASLLNLEQFADPFNYKLNIATTSVGATKPTKVDLVETFNYLLGLAVKQIDTIRGFKVVIGQNPAKESVLVVWRVLADKDNAALEEFMSKLKYHPRDTEFDHIYVNGDHTLEDPHSKVKMTEIEFKRLMFDVQDV